MAHQITSLATRVCFGGDLELEISCLVLAPENLCRSSCRARLPYRQDGIFEQVPYLIKGTTPLIAKFSTLNLQYLKQQLEPFLKALGQIDLVGLLNALKPLLTEDNVKGIVGLLGNAEKLPSDDFLCGRNTNLN